MQPHEVRNVHIDLPLQRTYNSRLWLVAGLLFALLILLATAYAYLEYRGLQGSLEKKTTSLLEATKNIFV